MLWVVNIILFVVVFLLWFTPKYLWYRRTKRLIYRLPGPKSKTRSILGDLKLLLMQNLDIRELTTYTPSAIFRLFEEDGCGAGWAAFRPAVAVGKAEFVEAVLSSTTNITKAREYKYVQSWLGSGLITNNGSLWRKHRKILTPAFHFRILEEFIPVVNEQAKLLVEKLADNASEPWTDLLPFIGRCTLDVICETSMGVQIGSQNLKQHQYAEALKYVQETFLYRAALPWLQPNVIFYSLPMGRQYLKHLKTIHAFTKKGHDTTSLNITWTLYLLGHHPETQAKVQEEMDSIFGADKERPISADDMKLMKYLECIIKESQRLYPPVPLLARYITEDIQLNKDHIIPVGSLCIVLIQTLHRDRRAFPKPHHFIPERFLPENSRGRHPYAFIPFSAGPRNCIGQRFAMNEEKIVLSWILRHFSVKSLDHQDKLLLDGNITLKPRCPIRVKLTPR